MKKVFIQTQFGKPHEWTQQYIDHVQHLEEDGWYWKIFTPNAFKSKGNVEIIPMTIEEFNDLTEKRLGVRPTLSITETGIPSSHITDFYTFSGAIFSGFLEDADFWGMTNLDVVYGKLNHFIPDELLNNCDIFSDDVNTINGVFSLFRNNSKVNYLYTVMENWKNVISQPPCKGCIGIGKHRLFGSDEYILTEILRNVDGIKFQYPKYYPILSHDRLEQHVPKPKLEIKEDGSLWELFADTNPVRGELGRPMIGKEIAYFHFSRTKRWPL